MKCERAAYELQDPKDFAKLVLPPQFKENMLMLAPTAYLEVLNQRNAAFEMAQAAIKAAKLTPEQEKQLRIAIQGYFREWVVSTNQIKGISDLVKMIDNEEYKSA